MVKFSKFLKSYKDAGAFHTLLAPHRFLDEFVFLTKTNQLGLVMHADGIDPECLTEATLETISKRVGTAWRGLDDRFRIYQYVIKQDHEGIVRFGDHPNATSWKTGEDRRQFLEGKNLYSVRIVYVLLLEPPVADELRNCLSSKKVMRVMVEELGQRYTLLMGHAQSLQRSVGDLLGLRTVGKKAAFSFFRLLANLDPGIAGAEQLKYDGHLDYFMTSEPLVCAESGLRIGQVALEVLSMKEPPSSTHPNVFGELLALECNFILCSEFKRICHTASVATIRGAQNHWYWSQWVSDPAAIGSMVLNRGNRENVIADKSAVKDVEELDETLSRLNNQGEYLGQFSFTIVLYGQGDRAALQAAAGDVVKIFGHYEASLIRESSNALNAYLSIIPGNHAFNLRHTWLLSGNYADLSFLYAPDSGIEHNQHAPGDHLVVLETNDATPYYFNIWEGDRLGALILGAPGSGKSVLTNLIIDHSQKNLPRTFILDLGGSYRQIAHKHGGGYLRMEFGDGIQTFRINPFVLSNSPDNLQFLFSFVRLLLTGAGHAPSAADDKELFEAIESMYVLDVKDRTLSNLVLGLPRPLALSLQAWIGKGQYGSVFDNTEDTLTFAKFQVFDFQGMDELYPQVLEPLLFYIFQRISQVVYDPNLTEVPKQLWADEVWRFLANDTARQYLVSAGKTWRKHNGGIGLITQSADDLQKVGILDLINEICPKKLLLANPGADLAAYQQMFKLNDREVELFAGLIPKLQFLEKTSIRSKVLNVNLDRAARWLYANSPRENAARSAAIQDHGTEEGLRQLAAAS